MARKNPTASQSNSFELYRAILAFERRYFLLQPWFTDLNPSPDRNMGTLLLAVYGFFASGQPLHKKLAASEMGVQDIKTGRKYVAAAERLGLIEVRESPEDKRLELLVPTERLRILMEKELDYFAKELRSLVYGLLDATSPENEALKMISPKYAPSEETMGHIIAGGIARGAARLAASSSAQASTPKPRRK